MAIELTSEIERIARDEFPVTFDALLDSQAFGETGLHRRRRLVTARIWGRDISEVEEELLDIRVQAYAGKLLARTLIGPGIDYWSHQRLSQSAGTTEQVSYDPQRVSELKEADKRLVAEIADLLEDVEIILPPVKLVAGSAPHVQQAGKLDTAGAGTLATPDPFDLTSPYGPPDTTGTATS